MSVLSCQVFTIGAVRVRLQTDIEALAADTLVHPTFLLDTSSGGVHDRVDIDMKLVNGDAPSCDSAVRFDSRNGLSVAKCGSGYLLGLHRRGVQSPHTAVLSNSDTTEVTVFLPPGTQESPKTARPPLKHVIKMVLRSVIMNHLAPRGGVLVHAAGAVIDGSAIVFAGASTAGKSTLMRLFQCAGFGDRLLSDDRVVVRGSQTHREGWSLPEVWGTPWSSAARVARNAHAPLAAIVFLVKADSCRLVPMVPGRAMAKLMETVSYPWYDAPRAEQVFATCTGLVERTPCYALHFSPGVDVVGLLCGQAWGGQVRGEPIRP